MAKGKKKDKEKGKEKEKKAAGGDGEDKELKEEIIKEDVKEKKEKEETKENEEELIKELQEEINRLTTRDIIVQMMMSLSSLAYKKMGLPVGVNDKFKDKQQAKIAVDGFDALFKAIKEEVSEEERENLQSSLSNLQMNFVKIFS